MSSKSTSILISCKTRYELAMELNRFDAVSHLLQSPPQVCCELREFFPLWHARDFFYFICSSIIPLNCIRLLPPFPINNDVVMTHFMWSCGYNARSQRVECIIQKIQWRNLDIKLCSTSHQSSVSWTYLIAFSQATTFFRVMNNSVPHRRRQKMDHIIFEKCTGLVHTIVFSRAVPCL